MAQNQRIFGLYYNRAKSRKNVPPAGRLQRGPPGRLLRAPLTSRGGAWVVASSPKQQCAVGVLCTGWSCHGPGCLLHLYPPVTAIYFTLYPKKHRGPYYPTTTARKPYQVYSTACTSLHYHAPLHYQQQCTTLVYRILVPGICHSVSFFRILGRFLCGSDFIRFNFDLSEVYVRFRPINRENKPFTSQNESSVSEGYPAQKYASP